MAQIGQKNESDFDATVGYLELFFQKISK